MSKRIYSFIYAVALSLLLAAPQVNALALTTGVPNDVFTDANNRIDGESIWVLKGWLNSGIPLVLDLTLQEIQASGATKDYTQSISIDATTEVFTTDKGEALINVDWPPTDPVELDSNVDACVQVLFVRPDGEQVPFGDPQCVRFSF